MEGEGGAGEGEMVEAQVHVRVRVSITQRLYLGGVDRYVMQEEHMVPLNVPADGGVDALTFGDVRRATEELFWTCMDSQNRLGEPEADDRFGLGFDQAVFVGRAYAADYALLAARVPFVGDAERAEEESEAGDQDTEAARRARRAPRVVLCYELDPFGVTHFGEISEKPINAYLESGEAERVHRYQVKRVKEAVRHGYPTCGIYPGAIF